VVGPLDHIYVYGAVPPEGVELTVPVLLLQATVLPIAVTESAVGWVTIDTAELVQPFASDTVTV
jgi:hypothetical protein